jgi:hypothetical protein
MKLVQWFDIQQPNAYEGNTGDWSFTHTPMLRDAFLSFLNSTAGGKGYWQFTPASHANISNNKCMAYTAGVAEPPPPPVAPVAPQPPAYQWYELRANVPTNRTNCYSVTHNWTTNPLPTLTDRMQSWQCKNYTTLPPGTATVVTQRFRMQIVSRNSTATIATFVDKNGRCLEVGAANVSAGAQMQVGPCTGGKHQQVRLSRAGSDIVVLILQHAANRCATLLLASPRDGTNIVSSSCTRGPSQQIEVRAIPFVRRYIT